MKKLLFGCDEFLCQWVAKRMPYKDFSFDKARAIGITENQEIIAAVVYSDYRDGDLGMSVASITPKWADRFILEQVFTYPFTQLNCNRVSAWTGKSHGHTREFLERLGFQLEGIMRKGMDSQDICLYGMLKEECKWIRSKHGEEIAKNASST